MDWTEKIEHKKKIRKMAYRMLWADFKNLVCGWKVVLVLLMYLGFFLLPYVKEVDDFNAVSMYYFVIWVFMALGALAENSFNYLPLSSKDILYYLKIRTNHITSWLVLVSGVSAIVMDAFGVELFWERGAMVLLFLLVTVEWYFFMQLYTYSKPIGETLLDSDIPTVRKIRIVIYNVYGIGLLFACMFVGMFMDCNEKAKVKVLVFLCLYLGMYIFRADASGWVCFKEFTKASQRSMWGNVNTERLNQK